MRRVQSLAVTDILLVIGCLELIGKGELQFCQVVHRRWFEFHHVSSARQSFIDDLTLHLFYHSKFSRKIPLKNGPSLSKLFPIFKSSTHMNFCIIVLFPTVQIRHEVNSDSLTVQSGSCFMLTVFQFIFCLFDCLLKGCALLHVLHVWL